MTYCIVYIKNPIEMSSYGSRGLISSGGMTFILHMCKKSQRKMCSCTYILLNGVWMVKAKHSLTDDHCFQLYTASLKSTESHSDVTSQPHVY